VLEPQESLNESSAVASDAKSRRTPAISSGKAEC
jgi:hypothetical protein